MEKRLVVMVVENDTDQLWLFKRWLEEAGYHVMVAEDGAWALSRMVLDPPDLVLLDFWLPAASGFEVCQSIKESKNGTIPVIGMIGKQEEHLRPLAKQAGADSVLGKPFSRVELVAHIQKVLGRKDIQNPNDDISKLENKVWKRLAGD